MLRDFFFCVCLHRDFHDVLADGVGDDSALDGLAVEGDALHTLL